jgi:hypothetical protein
MGFKVGAEADAAGLSDFFLHALDIPDSFFFIDY